MFSTLLIAAFSCVLFIYWLRYNCVLILRRQFPRDRAPEVAAANNLRLPEMRRRLEGRVPASELPNLYRQIVRDHRVLAALVHYTAVFHDGSYTIEQRLLALDFHVMQAVFLATHVVAPAQARRALTECVRVLEYFANVVGERAVPAQAR